MRGNDITWEQLKGRQVLDRSGFALGNVEDVTIDPDALRVTGFIIKMDREAADRLHVDRPALGSARLEVTAERLASIGDSVLLNIDQRDMSGMLYDTGGR